MVDGLTEILNEKNESHERLVKAYYSTFHSPEGQLVLQDLLGLFYRSTSITDPVDPNATLVHEGRRMVVIHILATMEEVSGQAED